MRIKVTLVILVLLNVFSCEGKRPSNEYSFEPIGWHFKLPDNWIVQDGSEINSTLVKNKKSLGLSEQDILNFEEGKLFFLKTNEGFNRFTSELTPFSGSESQFEIHANNFIEQSISQLKRLTEQTEVLINENVNIKISGNTFKKSSIQFKFEENASNYFEMGIYVGKLNNKILSLSYTCIKGDKQCTIARNAIERSVLKKI